ncbi:hypothetical protein PFICI_14572 [Pestalotiopsis fici W106-1]|uniref:Zn(2)-C6 fungal-type domain-containing protein n=1 Tax=Pestalotiopsis fici (strain W106-1 / CGMCC3.15140) TaxID=1229662 RepID=W3WLD4_PESFW|nr:uncharacterized protein PFICI_14572 [Pestalotiopsis fici W106-1]ETS73626.1 hypothetical protein PFICI_14572 [Pestalotiopsis fici W106-1]
MFYTGKSTACHTCRQRRLKCDEVRPHCLKCRRAGRECLGYRDESAFIIRDMTTATIQKFEHKSSNKSSISGPSGAGGAGSEDSESASSGTSHGSGGNDHHNNNTFTQYHPAPISPVSVKASSPSPPRDSYGAERDRRKIRKQKSFADNPRWKQKQAMVVKPVMIGLPLEDRAFCYFANRYAFAPAQYLDPGYLPVLKVVSQKKNMGPCLTTSLSAVSLAAFSTKLNARKAILKARSAYATALQLTNEAIQNPGSCRDDELLASVVLLALFEVMLTAMNNLLTYTIMLTARQVFCSDTISGWSSHIFGAAAMLGARGKVSFRDKLVRALFRVISNESIKLKMLGVQTPHTGTEIWLRWLSDPRYMTYITPDGEPSNPDSDDIVDLSKNTEGLSLEDVASLKGSDAVGQVESGPAGTLPVPQTTPNAPVGYTGPQSEDETYHITQALNEAKGMIIAYSMNSPPVPNLDEQEGPASSVGENGQALSKSKPVNEIDRTYRNLAQISLYVAACTARLVTYNVMARLAASLSHAAADEYAEAVTMGRKEISEILRMTPHFFRLIEETSVSGDDQAVIPPRGSESPSSSDNSDSSSGSGDGYGMTKKARKRLPTLARSYIGLMILWPIATAAATDLIEPEQFQYIMGMMKYIIDVCGIRMGTGIRQFCLEKRELAGAPFAG